MRTALAVAVIVAMTGGAMADFPGQRFQPCDNVPPVWARNPPTTVPVVFVVPDDQMAAYCGKTIPTGSHEYGCTFADSSTIFVNGAQTAAEVACTLLYEEAHLPPNNWQDPSMEAMTPDR